MVNDLLQPDARNAKPGDLITFGRYPAAQDGADKTPIRWRVLQNSGSQLFMLSEYILDCKRYHGAFTQVTWQDCDLRQWLNDAFYQAAFDSAEQRLIQTALCADNGPASPDTEDRVFLLSAAEAQSLTDPHSADPSDVMRRTTGTAFAREKKADGCRLYEYNLRAEFDYLLIDGKKRGCSWWWLRTQPGSPDRAGFIGTHGSIRSYCRVNRVNYGVRPAIKLSLE